MAEADGVDVTLLSIDNVTNYQVERYYGLIQAGGSNANEAILALEKLALRQARRSNEVARRPAGPHTVYTVLGVRITAGINASGQPVWIAYGTLARSRRLA